LKSQQARIRMQILLAAVLIITLGLVTARIMAIRLARPVEELAVATEQEHQQRLDAESALDTTSRELERAARFSADASHQLKTPVAVVRAGLEELLVDPGLPDPLREEVNALIRHTGRLTHVIEDLLLLSRLDAGRLDLPLLPVNLRLILDGQLDDLSVLPQEAGIQISLDGNGPIWVQGNPTYTSLILQNLLENAWKYNRPGGRIDILVEPAANTICCRIGNTGKGIPVERQPLIFERFHRGPSGENVPGYGLGLNLAAKLADLHGGRLTLLRSDEDWTAFELTLKSATPHDPDPEETA
jgi:signal transduction histidine kinase